MTKKLFLTSTQVCLYPSGEKDAVVIFLSSDEAITIAISPFMNDVEKIYRELEIANYDELEDVKYNNRMLSALRLHEMMKGTSNTKGFTLLEIMIAMTVFSLFVTAFVVSQGNNLADLSICDLSINLKTLLQKK